MDWKLIGSYDDFVTDSPFPIRAQNVSIYIGEPEPDAPLELDFQFKAPRGAQMDLITRAMINLCEDCEFLDGWMSFNVKGVYAEYRVKTAKGNKRVIFQGVFLNGPDMDLGPRTGG